MMQCDARWAYKTTADDAFRKEKIINVLKEFGPFNRALDIGAGEGYVTESIRHSSYEL